jgi:hypothetical protein
MLTSIVPGTFLIAVGAVLIGYFGVVQEPTHSLDDLLALYARPPFIAFASFFALAFVGIVALAHLAEWQLHVRLFRPTAVVQKGKGQPKRRKPSRRWSAPSLAPLVEVSESSSGIATPNLEIADEAARRGIPVDRVLAKRSGGSASLPRSGTSKLRPKDYGSINSRLSALQPASSSASISSTDSTSEEQDPKMQQSTSAAAAAAAVHDPAVRRTCLGLAVAYGGASGTLSGACLLLAKSGVELLVLTIAGNNQFDRWQSWFLIVVMLAVALLQLWYLNKSLRLADPTLVCPLAFCFYNTSSIMLGLVYFNQLGSLSPTSLILVVVGIAVLLAGVWTVSMHGSGSQEYEVKEEERGLLADDAEETLVSPTSSDSAIEADATTSLLANVGGIAGPHLPPMTPGATMVNSPSPLNDADLPSSPKSPSTSSLRGHSRTRSRSGSFVAGLGMHVPGLPVQSVRFEGEENDIEAGGEDGAIKKAQGSSNGNGSGSKADSPRVSPTRSKRHFYETLLERGLSIGISPSSPGFHLRQTFEEEIDAAETSSSLAGRHLPRRTFSEADVDAVEAVMAVRDAEGEVQDEELLQEQERSAWARVIPAVDYHALSDRLNRLRHDTRGWFGDLFVKGD